MAIYRQLHTTFWSDDFIGECSQIEKLFYLYLISNDKTTQSGAYGFSYRYTQFELGISKKEVDELIDFFVASGKIRFNKEHNEVLIVNWLKYNSARSPKVAPVVDRELESLKTVEFKSEVVRNCIELGYPIKTTLEDITSELNSNLDTISNNIDTLSKKSDTILQPTHNQQQHITRTNSSSSNNTDTVEPSAATPGINPFEFYQENFGVLAPVVSESINHWVADLGIDLVIEAMSRAVKEQKGFRYSEGIMKNWANRNILDMEAVKADDVAFKNRQGKGRTSSVTRTETLPEWAENKERVKETPVSPEVQAKFDEELRAMGL